MPGFQEVLWMDGLAQAALIQKRDINASELLEAVIERIEALNPAINAVIRPMYDQARKDVKAALPTGPFSGVPFLLKDIGAACAGVPQTLGSRLFKDFVPKEESELVVRQKKAGLILVGKTNTPEFGLMPTTEPELFGPTRNPWDMSRTPGGSSGGSTAAVAAGLVPMAHGNDGGGSIRIPASCCGVFGLKPTRARNPLGPQFGDLLSGLIAEHALTRSVRDSAALLDATSGPDLGDPYYAPPKTRPFLDEVSADPGRLRIAFTASALRDVTVHEDCQAAVMDAVKLCQDLGHEVEEASPALDGDLLVNLFMVVWGAGCAVNLDAYESFTGRKVSPGDVEPLTWAIYEIGRKLTAATYLKAVMEIQRQSRLIARFFTDYDVWLTPTLAEPPVPLGTFDPTPENPKRGMGRAGAFSPFTGIANLTGQPAMSVPLFWNGDNLPIGAHFIGRTGDEATLFRLAGQLEKARPWADRKPPLAG